MKPIRLKILIMTLTALGLIVGLEGFLTTGIWGVWNSITLTCFFAAHLLAIPHNSGRYWTAFIALGLFILAGFRLKAQFGGTNNEPLSEQVPLLTTGFPILCIMIGVILLMLAGHPSVNRFFERIEGLRREEAKS